MLFLVILNSFTYHCNQIGITLDTLDSDDVQTGTRLVTTVDADSLQTKEHL